MIHRRVAIIAVLAGLLCVAAQQRPGQRRPASSPAPPKVERAVPFSVGERLSYDINWSSFITATAATATLDVREKRPALGSLAYSIVAEGRPTPLVAMLYSVYYKVDTWMDASSLLALRASVYSQEGARRETKVTLFERPRGLARYEVQEGSSKSARNITVPPQTHDPISAIFTLRASPMKAGTRMLMPMVFDGNLYQVQVTIDRRESLRTGLGTLPAWHLTPVVLDRGKPADSPRGLALWISDDARRLPLKMSVEIPVGRFELTMTGAR